MHPLVFSFILTISLSSFAQSYLSLGCYEGEGRDSICIEGVLSEDLLGNGMLTLRLESGDSSLLKVDFFGEMLWAHYLNGKIDLLQPELNAKPIKVLQHGLYFQREFIFPLSLLQLRQIKNMPLKYFIQRDFEGDVIKADTFKLSDPWLFSKASIQGRKYWENRDLQLGQPLRQDSVGKD